MSFKEEAEAYYVEHYKGRGLAPKHVVALKESLAKALRKGEKAAAAAKTFFKEKEITLTDKPSESTKPNKPKAAAKEESSKKSKQPEQEEVEAPEPKKRKNDKNVVVPLPSTEVASMDRKSLKATIAQLTDAGVKIVYNKSDDDDVLRRKINDAMTAMPSPETIKMLESIDPAKLVSVLKQDCLGIFIDVRSPSCQACPDVVTCTKNYLENLKGDFKALRPAMQEIKTEEAAAAVKEKDVKDVSKKTKDVKPPVPESKAIKWNPKTFIAVLDVDLKTYDKDHETYSTIKAVVKEVPTTFAELREIVEREYELKDDASFVTDWVIGLRSLNVIKLKGDLTEEEATIYRDAGLIK